MSASDFAGFKDLVRSLRPKRSWGQNFLSDFYVAEQEVEYADVSDKRVLEIGAGLGALTIPLGQSAREVVAVEKDEKLIPFLNDAIGNNGLTNVKVVHADFLEMELSSLGGFDRIVSNLPYACASPILFRMAGMDFERAVVLIQKELAQRMNASEGTHEYSRLSVTCQLAFKVKLLQLVPRNAFYPVPMVDSALVMLEKKEGARKLTALEADFINAVFQHKKKTLRNAVIDSCAMLGLEKSGAREIAESLFNSEKRVFTMSKEEILGACAEFEGKKK